MHTELDDDTLLQDIYQRLTFKTVAFWDVVSTLYNVNYVIKVDDDSYVRLDRLSIALSQWANMGAGMLPPLSIPDPLGQCACSP